ncbi:MAG: hypothetical protein PT951_04365 [Eubacteriales bacterium]|nr:hypothetical protein [Eubacteriales bacterium]MDY2827582.1 hypothetical protein [Eubacteriales bacterium]
MGFGWLLIGYLLAALMSLYRPLSVAMLIGWPLIIAGLSKLAHYERFFRYGYFLSFFSLPFALFFAAEGLSFAEWIPAFRFLEVSYKLFSVCYFLFYFAIHLFLLLGIARLSKTLPLPETELFAWRNFVILAVYQVLYLVLLLPVPLFKNYGGYFALPLTLLRLLSVLLNLWLFYRCFMKILPADRDLTRSSDLLENKKEGNLK